VSATSSAEMRWHVFVDHASGAGTGRAIYVMVLGENLAAKDCHVYPGSLTVEQLAERLRRASKCGGCEAAGGVVREEHGWAMFVVQHSEQCPAWKAVQNGG